MKTAEEFYKEIVASKELQEELKAASDKTLGTFLKKHDCYSTVKEFKAIVRSHDEGEIEDDDVEAIVGGIYSQPQVHPAVQFVNG